MGVYRILFAGVALLFSLATSDPSSAQDRGWGLGLIVGEPTGITAKNWISDGRAFDAAVAWSFSGYDSFQIHADYLFHNSTWQESTDIEGRLPLHYGIGARIKLGRDIDGARGARSDSRIGIRIPGGMAYYIPDAPIEVFVEIVPLLDIVPATHFDLNAAIGARYFFD